MWRRSPRTHQKQKCQSLHFVPLECAQLSNLTLYKAEQDCTFVASWCFPYKMCLIHIKKKKKSVFTYLALWQRQPGLWEAEALINSDHLGALQEYCLHSQLFPQWCYTFAQWGWANDPALGEHSEAQCNWQPGTYYFICMSSRHENSSLFCCLTCTSKHSTLCKDHLGKVSAQQACFSWKPRAVHAVLVIQKSTTHILISLEAPLYCQSFMDEQD